ncbi:MAG: hypothetical protein IJG48_01800 [Mogibacterium sp.]|nr:hypothetical protein [Mogibacterium sp.]
MEISVSFTDGDGTEYADGYNRYESPIGYVYVPAKGVIIGEPAVIRYEKHPWIETFELDGIRPEPARREGFGEKSLQGFVMSLGKVYDDVLSDYNSFNGEGGFDAEGFFGHVADRMIAEAEIDPAQFRRFAGFTENMWRLGDEPSYKLAMETIVPKLKEDKKIWGKFTANITEEFRDVLE